MEAFRYYGRLPRVVAVIIGLALAVSAMPSAAATRGGGDDYLQVSPTLSISTPAPQLEGNAGLIPYCFTITLSPTVNSPVVVLVQTLDGGINHPAQAGSDYIGISTPVTIPKNQGSVVVCVDVKGDLTPEFDDSFTVLITPITAGIAVGQNAAVGIIVNDDTGPVPTLLQAFDGETVDGGIAVTWQFTAASTIVSSWVERADVVTGPWTRIAAPTEVENGMLKVMDRSVESEHAYLYRLTAQLTSGEFVKFGPIEVKSGVIVREFAISQISPNPSRGKSPRIDFAMPSQANVKLSVLDIQGREVAVLVDGTLNAGRHQTVWNASSTQSGVYFIRYEVRGGKTFTQRVVVTQ